MNYEESAKELMHLLQQVKKPTVERHIDMISRGEGIMLNCVAKSGGMIMPSEIAKKAEVSTARVAAFLKLAEGKGYIKRESVESDRRKVRVILTDLGYEKVKDQEKKNIERTELFLKKLGEEDTENLIRIMKKLQTIVNSEEIED